MQRHDLFDVAAARVRAKGFPYVGAVTPAEAYHLAAEGSATIVDIRTRPEWEYVVYVSHLGADRASAYKVLQAKGIAEEHIRRSSLDYTILRSAIVYGPRDHFTTGLVRLLSAVPFFFLMPGDGRTHIQPLWVEDLVTCLVWALDDSDTVRRVIDVGGPEYLSFRQVVDLVM